MKYVRIVEPPREGADSRKFGYLGKDDTRHVEGA